MIQSNKSFSTFSTDGEMNESKTCDFQISFKIFD